MIQGLVVLLVSTDVLVVYLWRLRSAASSRQWRWPHDAAKRDRLGRASRSAFLAFFIAVPPLTGALARGRRARRAGGDRRWAATRRARREAARLGRDRRGRASGWPAATPRRVRRVTNLERVVVWGALLAATLRYATPLIFGALGGLFSERSGVINIALEGMMLMGAFFGAWGADITGSWFLGHRDRDRRRARVFGALHALFAVTFRADQIVSGTALNLLAVGITGYLYVEIYGDQGTPDDLPQVPDVHLPIESIPFIGDVFGQLNLLVWIALAMVLVTWVVVFRTPTGLRLRSVGREPAGGRDRRPDRSCARATAP